MGLRFKNLALLAMLSELILGPTLTLAQSNKNKLEGYWNTVRNLDGSNPGRGALIFYDGKIHVTAWDEYNEQRDTTFSYKADEKTLSFNNVSGNYWFKGDSLVLKFPNEMGVVFSRDKILDYDGWEGQEENRTSQTQNNQNYEDEQAGPEVYGTDEWVKVASDNYSLEWKIDQVSRKRIGWDDMWRAAGLDFKGLSEQDISDMQSKYLDFVVLRLITRGTSNKEQSFDLTDFPICYPYNCPMYREQGTYESVLEILNGNSSSFRRVTKYTPDTTLVPYLIYTNVGGGPSEWQRIPDGILRIGSELDGGKRQVEIGSFK